MNRADEGGHRTQVRSRWWFLVLGIIVWFGLWFLTPGLTDSGPGQLFTESFEQAVLIESLLVAALAAVLVVTHRAYSQALFAPSRTMWLYVLPSVLAVALPLHYGGDLPVWTYMIWMTVSVFWQDYVTFGLLHCYLRERLSLRVAVVATAGIFWLGHVLLIPHRFGVENIVASTAILALGLVLAWIRASVGTLHLILALHLAFYFAFA